MKLFFHVSPFSEFLNRENWMNILSVKGNHTDKRKSILDLVSYSVIYKIQINIKKVV